MLIYMKKKNDNKRTCTTVGRPREVAEFSQFSCVDPTGSRRSRLWRLPGVRAAHRAAVRVRICGSGFGSAAGTWGRAAARVQQCPPPRRRPDPPAPPVGLPHPPSPQPSPPSAGPAPAAPPPAGPPPPARPGSLVLPGGARRLALFSLPTPPSAAPSPHTRLERNRAPSASIALPSAAARPRTHRCARSSISLGGGRGSGGTAAAVAAAAAARPVLPAPAISVGELARCGH